jgi:hypothetical protein
VRADGEWGAELYNAYDRIVEEDNIPREASHRCFKFLARMQRRPRESSEALMDRFVSFLLDIGIEVAPEDAPPDNHEAHDLDRITERTEPGETSIEHAEGYKTRSEEEPLDITGEAEDSRTHRGWIPLNGQQYPEDDTSSQLGHREAGEAQQPERSGRSVSPKLINLPPRKRGSYANLRSQSQDQARRKSGSEPGSGLNGRAYLDDIERLFSPRQPSVISNRNSTGNESSHGHEEQNHSDNESGYLGHVTQPRRHSTGSLSDLSSPVQSEQPSVHLIVGATDMMQQADGFRIMKDKLQERSILQQWRNSAMSLQRRYQREAIRAREYHDEVLLVKSMFKWRRKMTRAHRAEDHRQKSLLSTTITQWRRKTVESKRRQRRDEKKAIDFSEGLLLLRALIKLRHEADRRRKTRDAHQSKLLQDAFSAWRDRVVKSHEEELEQVVEEEHERKARLFRRVGLLSKAFSHWRQTADEALRNTATARRHMLHTKYFNHWQDVTINNELKVRRHIAGKFVNIWRQRTAAAMDDYARAMNFNGVSITRRGYSTLLHASLELKAPRWRALWMMKKFFMTWCAIVCQRKEKDVQADQMRHRGAQKTIWKVLTAKYQRIQTMKKSADDFKDRKIIGYHLQICRKQAQLAPREREISRKVDGRIAYTALSILRGRTQMAKEADQVNKNRMLKNAFTQWGDLLRVQFLQEKINEHILAKALYQWVIAGRAAVAVGQRDSDLGRKYFTQLVAKAQAKRQKLLTAEQAFVVSERRIKLRATFNRWHATVQRDEALRVRENNFATGRRLVELRAVLSQWRLKAQLRIENEARAITYHNNRLLGPPLSRWRIQNTKIQLMKNKVDPARFFLLTTNTLRIWQLATTQHQKQRRREIYDHVRRRAKMGLARNILNRMQSRLAQVQAMDRTATQKVDLRALQSTSSNLNTWRAMAQQVVQQTQQADSVYQRRALHSFFSHWRTRHAELQRLQQDADSFCAGWAAVYAINCLRALDRRLFQLRGQEQWAISLQEKHGEKHVKNMLRYWAERAVALQQGRSNRGDRPMPSDNRDHDDDDDEEEEDENEDSHPSARNLGTGAVDTLENLQNSTPLPGYLRTPSKRHTARSHVRERLGSGIPIPTPFLGHRIPEPPATAPARQSSSSAVQPLGRGGITPFERKLRDQGYSERRLQSSNRQQALGLGGAGRGGRTPGRTLGFAGFEDIPEDRDERKR